jgi:hypothetical protein
MGNKWGIRDSSFPLYSTLIAFISTLYTTTHLKLIQIEKKNGGGNWEYVKDYVA